MILVSLLAVVMGGIRMVLIDSSREEWALYLLVIPSQVIHTWTAALTRAWSLMFRHNPFSNDVMPLISACTALTRLR